jgi:glutamate carboxypeptidase
VPAELNRFLESRLPVALDWLRRMVEINSWTDNRAGVNRLAGLTAETFADLGFAAESVPSMNPTWGDHLVLTRPGTGPRSLALVSHLDTVFPPDEEARNNFRWQPEGDRIYGPGTHDIKGGTVMMWLVLSALRELAPAIFAETTWKLLLNSSEECYSPDFGALVRQRCDGETLAALVFEAEGRENGVRRLVIARKGRATWRVTARGRGAHAGGRHAQGANAIVQLARTVQQLATLTDYPRELTCNVARISGGSGLNRVPHEATAEGEFRAFAPEVFAQARAAVLALNGPGDVRSVADGFTCDLAAEILTECRPWPRNAGTDRLLACWQSAAEAVGQRVDGEYRGGLSDGNLLWDALPTMDGLGPWGDNDHCSERSPDGAKLPEFVEVSSFVPKAALNVAGILGLLQPQG